VTTLADMQKITHTAAAAAEMSDAHARASGEVRSRDAPTQRRGSCDMTVNP